MGEPKMGLPARKRTAVEVTQFPVNRARTKSVPAPNPLGEADEERKDYFITRNGVTLEMVDVSPRRVRAVRVRPATADDAATSH